MHIKIFCGQILDIEKGINDWLREVAIAHIVDIKTIVLRGKTGPDSVAVLIFWA